MIFNTTSAGKPEQTKTATPSLSQQTISPDSGKTLSGVTINPITAALLTSLDPDFKAENIAEGVDMFGLIGTLAGAKAVVGQVTPAWNQLIITGLPFKPQHIMIVSTSSSYIKYGLDNYYSAGGTSSSAFIVTLGEGEITVVRNTTASSLQFSGTYYYAVWVD